MEEGGPAGAAGPTGGTGPVAEALFEVDRQAHLALARESMRGGRVAQLWVPAVLVVGAALLVGGVVSFSSGSANGIELAKPGSVLLIGGVLAAVVHELRVRRLSREAELDDPGRRHILLFEEGAVLLAGDNRIQYSWHDIQEVVRKPRATLLVRRRNRQGLRGTVLPTRMEARDAGNRKMTPEQFLAELERLWKARKDRPAWQPEPQPGSPASGPEGYS